LIPLFLSFPFLSFPFLFFPFQFGGNNNGFLSQYNQSGGVGAYNSTFGGAPQQAGGKSQGGKGAAQGAGQVGAISWFCTNPFFNKLNDVSRSS
jgi:hypothetical protein